MSDNNNVELSVRSQLKKIIEELEAISNANKDVQEEFKKTGEDVGKRINDSAKKTGTALSSMGERARGIANQIVRDFKALMSIEALTSGMKISEQFKGSFKETVALSDAIRRLGPIFGMTQRQAESFQSKVAGAMGEIGASSEEAANALTGLSQTPIKDEKQLIEYSKTAVKLGSIGGTPGRSGEIGKGLSDLVIARGGKPGDLDQMAKARDEVLRIMNATGKSAIEVQSALKDLYLGANESFKPMLQKGGAATMAAAELYGGQDATKFVQRYIQMPQYERERYKVQGTGSIVDKEGKFNQKAIEGILKQAKDAGGGDVQQGLQSMFGLSAEEAKGLMRLSEALKNNKDAIEKSRNSLVNIEKQYLDTMSFGDAFRANINRIKGAFSSFLDKIGVPSLTQKATEMMVGSSQDTMLAGASVAGGGILAAILASGGLKGIGGALGGLGGLAGGAVKGKVMQEATGATPVYVVNAAEIGAGGGLGGLAGAAQGGKGLLGKLGTIGAAAGAGFAGYEAGKAVNENIVQPWLKESPTGQKVDAAMLSAITKLGQMLGLLPEIVQSRSAPTTARVMIENKTHDIKASVKQPSRGATQ